MKRTVVFVALLTCWQVVYAQWSPREQELMAIAEACDSIPRTIFLDSLELPGLHLSGATNTHQVWSSKEHSDIIQFYDVRLMFDAHQQALDFHRKFRNENAEFGKEITRHKIKTGNSVEFGAYHGEEALQQLMAGLGLHMYCYTFVVDRFFVKFYISCKKKVKPEVIQPYLDAALASIKTAGN
ncbi:MAG: hypothetical protein JNM00_05380 [Flavobacteriales bacterium]|nr:hypothetical protein [Flavobacteriales bacterium]